MAPIWSCDVLASASTRKPSTPRAPSASIDFDITPQSLAFTDVAAAASWPKRSTCRSVKTPACSPTRILRSGTPLLASRAFALFPPAIACFAWSTVNLRPRPADRRSSTLVLAPVSFRPSNAAVPRMPSGMKSLTLNAADLVLACAIAPT